jgi:peptidoglycan/xylan/chitin deacetylase (PgdA/CDA1 family)
MSALAHPPRAIPVLLYHTICDRPARWIAPFAVTPGAFRSHMDEIVKSAASTLTVSSFADLGRAGASSLPERLVLVTFDDGFADTHDEALPVLAARGIASTLYVTTAFALSARSPYGDRMVDFAALEELASAGMEIGGHSHTHAQLDTLAKRPLHDEVTRCKDLLEQRLATPVRSFAYPHGYSSAPVRRTVREAGYESACAVTNALTPADGDPLRIARLTVRSTTSPADIARWIRGEGVAVAPRRERAATSAWRAYRRARVRLGVRPPVEL